jgi:phospholipid/cholesterol/gamma-HCH transport system permease protein
MHGTKASALIDAHAELRREGDSLVVVLAGEWSLEQTPPRFDALMRGGATRQGGEKTLSFDATDLGGWDTSLLVFLKQCQDSCDQLHLQWDASGLPERALRLLALANAVPERVQADSAKRASFVTRFGAAVLDGWADLMAAITFTGEVALSFARLFTRTNHMRWRQFWVVVETNSSGALPIVTLIALLVGVIIAFLGVVVLERFGAGYYVSYLVGFGMLREMASLMTGIIIAGRTGAAFAAELGTMKVTEEIDAYTTLGLSPIDHLVLPRILGLFFMMPLLTLYADVVGIAGGMLVSWSLLDLSFTQFTNGLLAAVTLSDALLGLLKGTMFGLIVGVAGCMKGLQGGSDASAVGRAATAAVVLGITLIVAANALVDWLAALLNV